MNRKELIPNPEDHIMCVKLAKMKWEDLYEFTRNYSKVDITRARRATYVQVIVKSIAEKVYNPVDWKNTEEQKTIR